MSVQDLANKEVRGLTYKLLWGMMVSASIICSSIIGGCIYITRYMEERKGIDNIQNQSIVNLQRDQDKLDIKIDKNYMYLDGRINANLSEITSMKYNVK